MPYSGKDSQYNSYVKNNRTGTIIYFPVMPNGISETVTANFAQQDITGASQPRIVYSNTSAKTISLSLQNLSQDYVADGFGSLVAYIRALQALVYPIYTNGGLVQSPSLSLVLGDDINVACVCTNVSVSWGDNVIRKTGTNAYSHISTANVDLTFIVTRSTVPGATYIENTLKG